jgi:AcrR family transcriptional regulator
VATARTAFDEFGYGGTSLREVARRAGVDPALIHHYFTDKTALFIETMALPDDPRQVAERAGVAGGFSGARVVEGFLAQWESDGVAGSPRFVAMVQAMADSPSTADAMREFLVERLPVHAMLGDDKAVAGRRLALISSQLVGLGWARYVMRFEPLASTPRHEVAQWVGPTLERYALGEQTP